jgi:methylmalonyl-CoA/ethylmalonyl-CoA epimerase
MLFHHLGIATKDIEKTKQDYLNIGYRESLSVFDPIQNVKLLFLVKDNSPLIELVSPIDEDSPVNQIIKKNGTTPYHICFEVDDLDQSLKELKKQRYIEIVKPVPAVAFNNRLVCFLYKPSMGLVELLSSKS